MTKKKLYDIKIESMRYPNLGISSLGDQKIQCKGTITGQTVQVRLGRKRGEYREAKKVQILEHSPLETMNPCPAFGDCGGCQYQRLPFTTEDALKQKMMEELFAEAAPGLTIQRHSNPRPRSYRNKMEYTFGDAYKGGPLVLGLHSAGRFYEMVDTAGCNIVHPDFEVIRQGVQDYFRQTGQAFYRKLHHTGLLRHLVIRCGFHTRELLINLVTTSQDEVSTEGLIDILLDLPLELNIVGILHTINDDLADAVKADELRTLYGRPYLYERVLGLEFKISPFSFFQPNVFGIENLYSRLLELAGDLSETTVYDLYSGTGTIGMILAKKAHKVIGVEIVEEAVLAARENAVANGIKNVEFRSADVLKELEQLTDPADLIVLDPPRAGIHPKALEGIISYQPKNFLYVSCNPKSMAEDLHSFLQAGYEIKALEWFDQFTRTPHVEALAYISV